MSINVRNLQEIRSRDPKLYEALTDIINAHLNIAQQVNGNSTGAPAPPPAISNLSVKAQNGHFTASITDNGQIYRGIQYYIEHADNPQFTDAQRVHLGDSRDHQMFLGNVTRYFRAYSSYSASAPSSPVFHGDSSSPLPVSGGGAIGGPAFQTSQASGTGFPGQGATGPGPIHYRTANGAPPVR